MESQRRMKKYLRLKESTVQYSVELEQIRIVVLLFDYYSFQSNYAGI